MAGALDLELLERTRESVNTDRTLARLGSCDVRLGIRTDGAAYVVDFAAFECAAVAQIDDDALRDVDIVIAQAAAAWRRYLKGRRDGTAPSLVSLDVEAADGIVHAQDPLKALLFERYHLTLQAFFDAAARLAAGSARNAAV
jgi:hypothetical protein